MRSRGTENRNRWFSIATEEANTAAGCISSCFKNTGSKAADYPYDNSCVESFFASMKKEYILRKEYDGMSALSRNIFYYVEMFYNRKRLHITLG